jgi:hypothetical protein
MSRVHMDWSKPMVRIYHLALGVVLLMLLLCGCRLDEHQRDWNRIRNSATEYGLRQVIEDIKKHLQAYPECGHRGAAEDYFVHSCKERDYLGDFCSDYVKTFPNGDRMAEVEEVFWHKCEKFSINCSDYAKTFPNGAGIAQAEEALWLECEKGFCVWYTNAFPKGKHIAVARAREKESEQRDAKNRELEAKQRKEIWNGPKIDAYLELQNSADPGRLTVNLLGQEVSPVGYSRYQIPEAFRTVDVCYNNHSWSNGPGLRNCTTMTLQSGNNQVPLSQLRITAPKEFKLMCTIGSEIDIVSVENTLDTGLFFMPGKQLLSCDVMGEEYRDDFTSGYSFARDVKVTFEAPMVPGFVDVVYAIRGAQVSAFVLPN